MKTKPTGKYQLEVSVDGDYWDANPAASYDDQPEDSTCHDDALTWAIDGVWPDGQPDDGGRIEISWYLNDADGNEIASEGWTEDVEPDHEALIKKAGGDTECKHEWIEGDGDQDNGARCGTGTHISIDSHCEKCGLRKTEFFTGSQYNPGESDHVTYEQPE